MLFRSGCAATGAKQRDSLAGELPRTPLWSTGLPVRGGRFDPLSAIHILQHSFDPRNTMTYEASPLAVGIFALFVAITLGLSFYLGARAKSASGYFAAGGGIHWFVNGIAFAGDYLSAASFLGICGMIAFYGYDGFLY